MPDKEVPQTPSTNDELSQGAPGPLVFISHDTRDADFAEAFSKLLKSVSAGMLKSFRSSDKRGTEGIEFGDEWFKRLTEKLRIASDVVCLFTERSLERPWILYEAGVARGTLQTPVLGIALGVSLSKVSTGPFYHFQNSDDTEDSLTKLILQLARRVPGIELDTDVVRDQVKAFKTTEEKLLEKLRGKGSQEVQPTEENLMAKFLEEMKGLVRELPSRVVERVADGNESLRRRRSRRFHPMMVEEIMHMAYGPNDPVGLLIMASALKDDFPWYYEMALEIYRLLRAGDHEAVDKEIGRMYQISEMLTHGPFMEEIGITNKDTHRLFMEFPRMVERMVRMFMENKKVVRRRRPPASKKALAN